MLLKKDHMSDTVKGIVCFIAFIIGFTGFVSIVFGFLMPDYKHLVYGGFMIVVGFLVAAYYGSETEEEELKRQYLAKAYKKKEKQQKEGSQFRADLERAFSKLKDCKCCGFKLPNNVPVCQFCGTIQNKER